MIRISWLVLFVVLLLFCSQDVTGRRGRGRGRSKSRVMLFLNFTIEMNFANLRLRSFRSQVQIGLPITGKYRDPESDQYYNNNNVIEIFLNAKKCIFFLGKNLNFKSLLLLFVRERKFCKHHILIMNTYWVIKSHFCALPKAIHVHTSHG